MNYFIILFSRIGFMWLLWRFNFWYSNLTYSLLLRSLHNSITHINLEIRVIWIIYLFMCLWKTKWFQMTRSCWFTLFWRQNLNALFLNLATMILIVFWNILSLIHQCEQFFLNPLILNSQRFNNLCQLWILLIHFLLLWRWAFCWFMNHS